MASFLIGIVVVAAIFYIAFIYTSPVIGLLGFAGGLFVVLAGLYLLYAAGRIGAAIRIPIAVSEKGQEVSVFLDVENRRHMPYMKIRCRLRSSTRFGKRQACWYSGGPVFSGDNSYRFGVRIASAGNYTIVLERLRIYDLSGLFHWDLREKKWADVQVLPKIANVSVRISERTRNFFGDADVYDDFRPGDDRSEIFDVRKFRAGDRIQSVHWKLSAKSDDLIVREDSRPLACSTVLLLDAEKLSAQMADAFLSVAASLIFSLMDSDCPHYAAWYSASRQEIVRVRVDGEEGYYTAVCAYMADAADGAPEPLWQAYQEKYRYDRLLHVLVLNGEFELKHNGQSLGAVNARSWKEDLAKLELLL